MRTERVLAFALLIGLSSLASAEPNHLGGAARPGVIPPDQVGRRQVDHLNACLLGRPVTPFVAAQQLPPQTVPQPAPQGPQNIPTEGGTEPLPLPSIGAGGDGTQANPKQETQPASTTASTEKPNDAEKKPEGANDANQLKLVKEVFARCVSCHKSSTAGDSLGALALTFGAGAKNGVPGLKDRASVLSALKTMSPMKGIYATLSEDQKSALEIWAKAK